MAAGKGLTITVTVVVDEQLPAAAVKVNVVVCCEPVELFNVPLIVDPVPLAAMPVRFPVLVLVQLKVVPGTLFGLVIVIFPMGDPEQRVCDAGVALTVGLGFTVTVTVKVTAQLGVLPE